MLRDTERLGLSDASSSVTVIEDRRAGLERYAARRGIKSRRFRDPKQLGVDLNRRADVAAYLMSHKFVHGNEIAATIRRTKDGDTTLFAGNDIDQGLLPTAAVWTARSALLALVSTAAIVGWTVPDDVDELLAQCDQMQARDGAAESAS